MAKSINEWSKDELLALPVRGWQEPATYDSVLLISTDQEHDSGWAVIAILGVRDSVPVEIAVDCCDDIEWILPEARKLNDKFVIGQFHMDCALASGAMHCWSRDGKFKVGPALSSTSITLIRTAL